MKRLTLRMPETLSTIIHEEAEKKGISVNQFLITLINRFLG